MFRENKKIAIDIALLLPNDVNKIVCELSSKIIPAEGSKPYVLDNMNYFPHISLLMGTVFENELDSIKEQIELIVKKYLPLEMVFTHIEMSKNKFPYLTVKENDKLTNLQKEIIDTISLDYDATKEMCADSDISELGISFINNYLENYKSGKSKLHVTLGMGDSSYLNVDLPIQTKVGTIAIGYIGYGCSFRKILSQVNSN